nr:hypothetical protein Iba_chr01cCG0780 [Ipomoea batatas]
MERRKEKQRQSVKMEQWRRPKEKTSVGSPGSPARLRHRHLAATPSYARQHLPTPSSHPHSRRYRRFAACKCKTRHRRLHRLASQQHQPPTTLWRGGKRSSGPAVDRQTKGQSSGEISSEERNI